MRGISGIFFFSSILLLFSCGEGASEEKFDVKRLEGRWESADEITHQIEEWTFNGNNQLKGRGFVLEGKDTTFIEFLSIRENNGVLTYFAQASDPDSPEIVPFAVVRESRNKIEFANETQDFPKKIVYEFTSDSTLQAYIEGPRDGQNIRIVFDFVRRQDS